nr:FeoB-associated Cys-rich membrane protein [Hoylesella enoeca]
MAWQYVIIALVITACLFYTAHRLRRTIRSAGDPCSGCPGCALHDQMVKKHGRAKKIRQCPNKKE